MKTASAVALISLFGLALQAHAATVVVKTCDDLKKAAKKTRTRDTVAQISPSNAVIDCNPTGTSFVTLAIGDNTLTVEVVDDGVGGDEGVTLSGVRFDVTGKLLWVPKATFNGDTEKDLVSGLFERVEIAHKPVLHVDDMGMQQESDGRNSGAQDR